MLHPEEFGFEALATKNENGDVVGFEGKDAKFLDDQRKTIWSKFNAQDWQGDALAKENFNMDTEEGRFFAKNIIKERGSDFMPQLGRRPRKEESRAIMQYIFKEGEFAENGLGDDWLLENEAESVLRYLDSPGARSLGIGFGRTRPEIEQIIARHQAAKYGGSTPQELRAYKGNLQAQLGVVKGEKRTRINLQIAQVDRMLLSNEELNRAVAMHEQTLGEAQNTIAALEQELAGQAQPNAATMRTLETSYQKEAEAKQNLSPYRQELSRRGVAAPAPAAQEQPISVQIARIRAREETLQEEEAVPGAAGRKTRKDIREKLEKQREALEKQRASLPTEIRGREHEAETLENKIIEAERSIQDVEREIATQQQLGAVEADFTELRTQQQAQQRRLGELREQKQDVTLAWEKARAQAETALPQERVLAKSVNTLRQEEKQYKSQLDRLGLGGGGAQAIKNAQTLYERTRNQRQAAERELAAQLRINELNREIPDTQTQLATATSGQQQLQQNLQNLRAQIAADNESVAFLESEIPATKEFMEEIAGLRAANLLRQNPELGMDAPEYRTEVERRIGENRVMQRHQTRIQEAEQQLAQARQELRALPESMRRNPPPHILERVQTSQQRAENLRREMQNTRAKLLQRIAQDDALVRLGTQSLSLRGTATQQLREGDDTYQSLERHLGQLPQQLREKQRAVKTQAKQAPRLERSAERAQREKDKINTALKELQAEEQKITEGETLIRRGINQLSAEEKNRAQEYQENMQRLQRTKKTKKQIEDALKE